MEPSKVEAYTQFSKKLYPVVLFACGVFLIVLFLVMVGVYDAKPENSVVLFSYTSTIHLIALVLLYFGLSYFPKLYMSFLVVNGIWFVTIIIVLLLIYSWFDKEIRKQFNSNFLLHVFLVCYVLCGIGLEIVIYLLQSEIVKVVKSKKDVKGKSTRTGKSKYRAPPGKDTIARAISKEYIWNSESSEKTESNTAENSVDTETTQPTGVSVQMQTDNNLISQKE